MEKIKLLCFSHAGSSSTTYLRWESIFMGKNIEIIPVELPGRGSRLDERLCYELDKIIPELFMQHENILKEGKYAVFGHSMGSLVLYEFCRYCLEQEMSPPIHIFVSGIEAPHICKREKISHLNDGDFMKEVYDLGGCDEELIRDPEILSIFLPIIRNDFKLVENYKITSKRQFGCGLTVFNGSQDNISSDALEEWQIYTDSSFEIISFEGGHFYLFNYPERIAEVMSENIFREVGGT